MRCWISAEITSAAMPVTRLPSPSAARPAKPSGSAASVAVRPTARRGMSVTRSIETLGVRRWGASSARDPTSSVRHPHAGCWRPPTPDRLGRAARSRRSRRASAADRRRCARAPRRRRNAAPASAVVAATGSARSGAVCSWAATAGQAGSRSSRCRSRQFRQGLAAGRTSGPDHDRAVPHGDGEVGQPARAVGERGQGRPGPRTRPAPRRSPGPAAAGPGRRRARPAARPRPRPRRAAGRRRPAAARPARRRRAGRCRSDWDRRGPRRTRPAMLAIGTARRLAPVTRTCRASPTPDRRWPRSPAQRQGRRLSRRGAGGSRSGPAGRAQRVGVDHDKPALAQLGAEHRRHVVWRRRRARGRRASSAGSVRVPSSRSSSRAWPGRRARASPPGRDRCPSWSRCGSRQSRRSAGSRVGRRAGVGSWWRHVVTVRATGSDVIHRRPPLSPRYPQRHAALSTGTAQWRRRVQASRTSR